MDVSILATILVLFIFGQFYFSLGRDFMYAMFYIAVVLESIFIISKSHSLLQYISNFFMYSLVMIVVLFIIAHYMVKFLRFFTKERQ